MSFQICSSYFISDECRRDLTNNLASNLSIYDLNDYRRFLSAHLQFLSGLCDLSNQSINAFLTQFLSSLFLSTNLLSESIFNTQINSLIEQNKVNAPQIFLRLLFLLRNTNHANAIISSYGTNFQYLIPSNIENQTGVYVLSTESLTYDNNCSCAINSNCTIEATFIDINSSKTNPIPGLKMGCTPSESFLQSTLQCFYNSSCIDLIEEYVNSNTSFSLSLSNDSSRFPINTSIINLLDDLLIENWSISINYSLYFDGCSPSQYSYSYIQKFNSLYTITQLLSLCGGLTVVLRWISPTFIYLLFNIYQRWKRRTNRVHPICIIPLENNSQNSSTTNLSTSFNCFAFGFILFIIISIFITIPTVYFIEINKNDIMTTIVSTTPMTRNISITSLSTSIGLESVCQPTFEINVIYSSGSNSWPYGLAVSDLNGDKLSDIIILMIGGKQCGCFTE